MQQREQALELTKTGEVKQVSREYAGFLTTLTRMYRQEGWQSFFRGCLPNALRVAPGAAVTFVVYEGTMDYLELL